MFPPETLKPFLCLDQLAHGRSVTRTIVIDEVIPTDLCGPSGIRGTDGLEFLVTVAATGFLLVKSRHSVGPVASSTADQ